MYGSYDGKFLLSESVWKKGPATDPAAQTHPWTSPGKKCQPNVSDVYFHILKPRHSLRSPTGNSGVQKVLLPLGNCLGSQPLGHVRLPKAAKGMCGPPGGAWLSALGLFCLVVGTPLYTSPSSLHPVISAHFRGYRVLKRGQFYTRWGCWEVQTGFMCCAITPGLLRVEVLQEWQQGPLLSIPVASLYDDVQGWIPRLVVSPSPSAPVHISLLLLQPREFLIWSGNWGNFL